MNLFKGLNMNMRDIFYGLTSRVTLITHMWKSSHSKTPYCYVTVHFIDGTWTLKHKIVAFKKCQHPHTGQALFEVPREVIMHSNLEKKLCSIVVDNATNNDMMVEKLKNWLAHDLCLNGSMFHIRCSAHILKSPCA